MLPGGGGSVQQPLLRGGRGCCTETQRGCCTEIQRGRCTEIQRGRSTQIQQPPPEGMRLLHARNVDSDCRTQPRRALPAMSTECTCASIQRSEHPPHRPALCPRARERHSLVGTLGMFLLDRMVVADRVAATPSLVANLGMFHGGPAASPP